MRGSLLDTEWREKLPPICTACGYNLTGVRSYRCPECGRQNHRLELRDRARRVYHSLKQAEDVNLIVGIGVNLGVAAAAAFFLFWYFRLDVIGRLAGLFLGIGTLGTGVQVFRARGFPDWALEHMTTKPHYIKGIAVTFFGLAILALTVLLPAR